ncbi:MAG TPA: CHAD domain-containing protein [Acidimicrobiales bacterium]|nr:CHAD domain-containing protein [Acidimicrobiales bacterium]
MAYAFERDESVDHAIHRIARQQAERAVTALEGSSGDDLEHAVHDSRKRAKKLRALLRLVRPALGGARAADRAFRDAGRELSSLRDAHATLATFDTLVAGAPDLLPEGGVLQVREALAATAARASASGDVRARAETAADLLRAGARQVERAPLAESGWAAIGPGLQRTYRAGRAALEAARADRSPATVHEWRKRAKDGWYHVRLLRGAAPSVLGPLEERFHAVSDALGDAHDLAVIADLLGADPDRYGGRQPVRAVCAVAERRRVELEDRALVVGARLYAEKPAAHARRLHRYWRAWRDVGDEAPVGGLDDLWSPDDDLDHLDFEQLRDRAGAAGLPGRLAPRRDDLVGDLRARGTG